MRKKLGVILILLSLFSCGENSHLHEDLIKGIFNNSYKSYGGNTSGVNGGPTKMLIGKTGDGKIEAKVVNQTGNIYSGFEEWSDTYVFEFNDLFKVEKDGKIGFGGHISKSLMGTQDCTYNVVWLSKEDGREFLYISFFSQAEYSWSQWNEFHFEDSISVKENFRKIFNEIKFK